MHGFPTSNSLRQVFDKSTKPINKSNDYLNKQLNFIHKIKQIHKKVQEHINKSELKYKVRHEQHRTHHNFQYVYLISPHKIKKRFQGNSKEYKAILVWPFQDPTVQ